MGRRPRTCGRPGLRPGPCAGRYAAGPHAAAARPGRTPKCSGPRPGACCVETPWMKAERRLLTFAVAAVQAVLALAGDLGAVADQEAGRAGELVFARRNDLDHQFLARQVGTGQVDALGGVGILDVDQRGLRPSALGLQRLQRLVSLLVVLVARRVVIGCHWG